MPAFCKWTNSECTLNSDEITFVPAVGDARENFQNICAKLKNETVCTITESVPDYCAWDTLKKTCGFKDSKESIGMTQEEWNKNQQTLTNLANHCAKLPAPELCERPAGIECTNGMVRNELGNCMERPWYDWESCEEEIQQNACVHQNDPNELVSQVCPFSCAKDLYMRDAVAVDTPKIPADIPWLPKVPAAAEVEAAVAEVYEVIVDPHSFPSITH